MGDTPATKVGEVEKNKVFGDEPGFHFQKKKIILRTTLFKVGFSTWRPDPGRPLGVVPRPAQSKSDALGVVPRSARTKSGALGVIPRLHQPTRKTRNMKHNWLNSAMVKM